MSDYRAYILSPNGRFIGVHEITAADQSEAVTKAISLLDGHALELWMGDDYIGMLTPSTFGGGPIFKRPSKKTKNRNEPPNRAR